MHTDPRDLQLNEEGRPFRTIVEYTFVHVDENGNVLARFDTAAEAAANLKLYEEGIDPDAHIEAHFSPAIKVTAAEVEHGRRPWDADTETARALEARDGYQSGSDW